MTKYLVVVNTRKSTPFQYRNLSVITKSFKIVSVMTFHILLTLKLLALKSDCKLMYDP